jgi:ComF family protein
MFKSVLHHLKSFYQSVEHFVFPYQCVSCHEPLPDNFDQICPFCLEEFQYTYYEKYQEPTPLDQLFYGRVPLQFTYALLYFVKGSNTQKIIHAIKYQNNIALAHEMGKRIGKRLLDRENLLLPDALISVPLHPKKEFLRGYNQGSLIAKGVAEAIRVPFHDNILVRQVFTETQTKKGKYERWSNVEKVFGVKHPQKWRGKHLCLVDDVITTGSTLEACIRVLLNEIPDVKISVVAVATAKKV